MRCCRSASLDDGAPWAKAGPGNSVKATASATRIMIDPPPPDYTSPSLQAHLVAQVVTIVGAAGKVIAQDGPHLVDGPHDGVAGGAGTQMLHEVIADRLPVPIAHPRVDAGVADDGELPVLEGEIDEHRLAPLRAVELELREDLLGADQGITGAAVDAALEMHLDLAGGLRLGPRNGGRDGVEVGFAEEPSRPGRMLGHHQSPLAPPPPNDPPPPEKPPPPPPPKPPPPKPPPPPPRHHGAGKITGACQPRPPAV